MSGTAWLVFALVAIPVVGVVLWLWLDDSVVNIEPGSLGLLLVHGRATDRVLLPGRHLVPAFRRRMVVTYPSLELAYLAGDEPGPVGDAPPSLEHRGPSIRVLLGDRSAATVSYTVRCRLVPDRLRSVHERFGPEGLWGFVRDASRKALTEALRDPAVDAEAVTGTGWPEVQATASARVGRALADEGVELTLFALRHVDLGEHGEAIQDSARAEAETRREVRANEARLARARAEGELYPLLAPTLTEAALRHRQIEVWREMVEKWDGRGMPPLLPGTDLAARHEQGDDG